MKIAFLAPAGAMHRFNGSFGKSLHYAPLTLTTLAALIPESLNAEAKIYDETIEKIPLDLEADIIVMTSITGTSQRCYAYADYFRQRGITVVLGGVHPSLMPEEASQHADVVMIGFAEQTFPQMLLDFKNGNLKYSVEMKNGVENKIVILTATSGDTGKAAMAGFADVEGTGIIVFYPKGGVSKVQELQMVTQRGDNTAVVAIHGNFDDAQTGVKKIFVDRAFGEKLAHHGIQLSRECLPSLNSQSTTNILYEKDHPCHWWYGLHWFAHHR